MDKITKLQQAAAMIFSFGQNLPLHYGVDYQQVKLYHDNIDMIEETSEFDLSHFRIPPSEMRPIGDIPKCSRSSFLIRLDGLVAFLRMQMGDDGSSYKAKAIGF